MTDEERYLQETDVYAQSGFRGYAARWERARRPILEAVHRPGTFLDVGCANGLLMESVHAWSNGELEPYGLDLSERLVALARARLPQWADRIYVGDVLTWEPPRRFDFVRSELGYAPPERRGELVTRLLALVAPAGRLILCSYGSRRSAMPLEPLGDLLRGWGHEPELEFDVEEPEGALLRVAALAGPAPLGVPAAP